MTEETKKVTKIEKTDEDLVKEIEEMIDYIETNKRREDHSLHDKHVQAVGKLRGAMQKLVLP